MSKILFITNQYYPFVVGGAEGTVKALAEELHARGHEVVIVSIAPGTQDVQDVVSGLRIIRLAIRNLYVPSHVESSPLKKLAWHARDVYNPAMACKVAALLDRERPDWMSTHNLAGLSVAVWDAARARQIPIVHVIHDYYLMCPRTTMYKNDQRCQRVCTSCAMFSAPKRLASRRVSVVVGVSRFVLEQHLRRGYFPSAHAHVVHDGRPLQEAPPTRELHAGPLRVGFIGRVEANKGIETLLRAVSELPAGSFRLRVAGRAQAQYLAELGTRFPLADVEYLGFVEAAEFYSSIDVLVVPSLWEEPLGGVVYEALGYGLPVIASRVGGIPEMLEGYGCGWLVEPGAATELAERLRGLLDTGLASAELRERALARRAYFTPQRQADEYLAALAAAAIHPQK